MTQTEGAGQSSEPTVPDRVGARAGQRHAVRWPRLDQLTFSLTVGLAAALAIIATATINGFEISGVSALPLNGAGSQIANTPSVATDATATDATATDGTATDGAISASASPSIVDHGADVVTWAGEDRDGRVRYETTRAESLGSEALDQLDYDWERRLPEWHIDFIEGNDRVAGYTWSNEARIEVFVRPTATSVDVARILAHELGHAVDVTMNTGDERDAWLAQRGVKGIDWWPSSGAADFETGAGDFAECFAVLLVGSSDYRSVVAPIPTQEDLALITRLAN